jgi:hypothetical protein
MARENESHAAARSKLLDAFDADPDQILARAANDPVLFCNAFCYTLDHRQAQSVLPFVLWPYQMQLMQDLQACIATGEDMLIEKSRDMGCTWVVLVCLLWHWLYVPDFNAIIGSRKEDEVDKKGDIDTHFERMRFVIRHFPPAYAAAQIPWFEERHAGYMALQNPSNGAQIVGESTNSSFSRQGRYNVCWIDEFAVIDDRLQREIWVACGDSSPCRIVSSTPKGAGNMFAQLAAAAR